jgi:hypothetical protein
MRCRAHKIPLAEASDASSCACCWCCGRRLGKRLGCSWSTAIFGLGSSVPARAAVAGGVLQGGSGVGGVAVGDLNVSGVQ